MLWVCFKEKRNPSVEVKTVAVDFTEGQLIYQKIRSALATVSVGVLVNNVGMDHEPRPFIDSLSEDGVRQLINCNIMSMARLTNLVLPAMRKKRKGVILNISSLLGPGSTPYMTLYGASKVIYSILYSTFL